ncbi:hypothetical protein OEA41_008829 [Lepraria neglecta]|uniref:rRNA biogenesis protein RRP36 n=1 Tax=Lepraria neglecta TaxID=209136 RepID=A0AAD9Z258_9LECA|nr:hypothetical protein OEA41_008829 [Lepraria neglecta]
MPRPTISEPRPLSASAKAAPVNSLEPMNPTKDGFPLHPHSERLERRTGLLDTSFIQRVRARKEQSDSESLADSESDVNASNVSSAISQGSQSGHSDESDDEEDEASEESESEASNQPSEDPAASISFGALAAAQETLGKRKRSNISDGESSNNPLIPKPSNPKVHQNGDTEALERKAGKKDTRDFTRISKHAPTELSSKKAVSRKRSVVPTKKLDVRDPRFEPLTGPFDEQKTKKNYAFLDTYRDSEMSELKAAIRKTKDAEAKEKLKRAFLSMESRKKAQERKDQEQEVLRKHRREEKGKIEKGKKPFYLKGSEQKKLALEERFRGMKTKQVDRVIERRRKKMAQKERRSMPDERRG